MKIELGQECDYEREAECCKKMRDLLRLFPEFYVPNVIEELSTKQVFTTELISGLTIDQVLNSLSIMLKYIGLLEKLLVHCYYLDLILWFTNMFIPEVVIRPFKVYRDKVAPWGNSIFWRELWGCQCVKGPCLIRLKIEWDKNEFFYINQSQISTFTEYIFLIMNF